MSVSRSANGEQTTPVIAARCALRRLPLPSAQYPTSLANRPTPGAPAPCGRGACHRQSAIALCSEPPDIPPSTGACRHRTFMALSPKKPSTAMLASSATGSCSRDSSVSGQRAHSVPMATFTTWGKGRWPGRRVQSPDDGRNLQEDWSPCLPSARALHRLWPHGTLALTAA